MNDRGKLVYVKKRVATIRDLQSDFIYLYVPTEDNPADLLSRGSSVSKVGY